MSEKTVSRLSRRCLDADPFLPRACRHVIAIHEELQIVLPRQTGNEFLIRIRLRTTQLVIEMNDGKNNPQFASQLQKQAQESDGINPAGDGNADTLSSVQQLVPPS